MDQNNSKSRPQLDEQLVLVRSCARALVRERDTVYYLFPLVTLSDQAAALHWSGPARGGRLLASPGEP